MQQLFYKDIFLEFIETKAKEDENFGNQYL